MAGNILNYTEIEQKLSTLNDLASRMEQALNGINGLIYENVNSNKGIFDGNAASEFMKKWQEFETEIPSFIKNFKSQAKNVKVALENTKNADIY